MRVRRLLAWTSGLALTIALAVLCAAWYLTATEPGSRWLVARALSFTGEHSVRIARIRGRLIDHIELTEVAVDAAGSRVNVSELAFSWSPRALLTGELLIERLRLAGVEVTPPPPSADSERPTAVSIPALPLPGTIRDLTLLRVTIHTPDQAVVIDELSLAANWDRDRMQLTNVILNTGDHRLTADAMLGIGDAARHELTASWRGKLGDDPASATIVAAGPLQALTVELDVDGPLTAQIGGSVRPLEARPGVTLSGRVQAPQTGAAVTFGDIDLGVDGDLAALIVNVSTQAGRAGRDEYTLTASATLGLEATDDASATASVDWRAVPLTANLPTVAGHGRFALAGERIALTHTTDAPLATNLAGTVTLGDPTPALDVKLAWQDFVLPLGSDQDIVGRSGTLTAVGTPDALALVIAGSFAGTPVGPVDVDARGRLDSQRLNLETLSARLLDGTIETAGTFDWRGEPTAALRFSGRELDFRRFLAAAPSRVGFAGNGTFTAGTNGPRATLELDNVGGELHGHEISGAASLRTSPEAIVVDSARFAAGPNRLTFHGTWSDALDGEFDVALRDLGTLDPRLSGSLTGQGAVGGALLRPRIDAAIAGQGLKFDRFTAADLEANIDIDLARSEASQATLNFSGLTLDGDTLGDVTLRGSGTAAEHHLRLSFDGPQASFETAAQGHLVDDRWFGEVAEFDATSRIAGAWNLSSPSSVSVSGNDAVIADTCFESGAARVCLTASRLPAGGKARVAMTGVPLALADYYLPRTLRLRGALNGDVELVYDDGVLTGAGALAVADGIVMRETAGAVPEQVAIESLAGKFTLAPDAFTAEVQANVERWLDIDGAITTGRAPDAPLTGTFAARATNLVWLAEFAPELAGTDGELELTSTISGSRAAPRGQGRLRLASGALTLPDIGLTIARFDATFDASPEAIVFDAAFGAGDGELRARGDARKPADSAPWNYTVELGGEDFALVRLPEAEADVSPELKLAGGDEGLHVSGTLNVPRVAIDVKRLPSSAVSVSEDEIIVASDDAGLEETANRGFMTESVSGDVAIRFGDDISVNGFGLTSKLSGAVDWKKRRGEALGRASGKISIDEGEFKAYGQQLQIENGRIVFAGPVDNPNLNLRAYRPNLDVKAGVTVRGTVRDPKISLFSEPVQSDGDTLSYIVTGRALSDASAGESSMLAQAALSLGAEESAAVTNQIRGTFGLDEFSVNAGTTVQDTSLVAGKRLSPKLSVRTDYNPFEQLWTFFLNYKLTPNWSVEAESGERQGADLLYSVEGEDLIETLSPFTK